jgi:type VI secretion system protein ImpL
MADSGFKPSDAVTSLRKGLEDFLNQRFMATPSGRRIRTAAPAGARFTWDITGLQQALQLVEPYNEFAVGGLQSFRPELQRRLRVMALNRLEANMISMISNAERAETAILPTGGLEQEIQNEARQLKDVTKPLSDLLAAFDRLGFSQSYNDLSEATQSSAILHLRAVDQLFNQKAPYTFNEAGLSRWEGPELLVAVVFGVKDDKELPPYLEAQRENLKRMKEYADPALAIIASQRSPRRSASDAQLLAKWQSIAVEIEKYDNKNPSSNLAALEAFVGTALPTITVDNYTEKITPQDLAAQSSDFFLEKRNTLRRQVYERFDTVFTARAVQQYREIEALFNQRLAGKFPFSASLGSGEADPESIRGFYRLFDAYNKNLVRYLERAPGRDATITRVLQFVDQATSVRAILAPFLNDPKAAVPVFDYEVEFRVNRRSEVGGNNVIEWLLEVADQRISARDTMRQGRWVMGNPVRLTLRWAKDGEASPAPENADGIVFEDKRVTFEDTGRWALLKLMRAHPSAPADFEQLVDPTPETLKFIIPTVQAGGAVTQTKVFVRLTLLTPDKKEPITLPLFPDRAPSMDRT